MHIPTIRDAIRADCHVFCEKPLSDTTAGIHDSLALVPQYQKQIMVGLWFRFHKGLLNAKHCITTGRIG